MEVFQQPAVVQVQIEFCVGLIGRADPRHGEQPRLPVGKREAFGIEERLVGPIGRNGPLQRLVSLEPLVAHAGEERRQRRDLVHHLRRMLIVPAGAEMVGDVLNDSPVRPRTLERLEHLVEPLDPPLGAREGPFLLQARRRRQHDVGKLARVAEEDVLHDEEVELLEGGAHVVRVRVDDAHLLADEVHRLELALVDGVHHLVIVQALGRGQRDAPRRLRNGRGLPGRRPTGSPEARSASSRGRSRPARCCVLAADTRRCRAACSCR